MSACFVAFSMTLSAFSSAARRRSSAFSFLRSALRFCSARSAIMESWLLDMSCASSTALFRRSSSERFIFLYHLYIGDSDTVINGNRKYSFPNTFVVYPCGRNATYFHSVTLSFGNDVLQSRSHSENRTVIGSEHKRSLCIIR